MNGQRILEQVIRTQTALATPDFDLDAILRDLADEARALTHAERAIVETPDGNVIASTPVRRLRRAARSSLVVTLPETGERGALKVYSPGRGAFGAEDVRALQLLAGLIWSALTRAALTVAPAGRPPAS